MTFRFAGVSFLALLAAINISDLHAGKKGKGQPDLQRQDLTAKQKRKDDKRERQARDEAYRKLPNLIPSFFDPKAIEISTPSKEDVYAFRSELSKFLQPYRELLRGENSQSKSHLIQAVIGLYREIFKLNDHFEKRFYEATGPIDCTTNQRMNMGMSEAPSENLSPDSEVFFRIVKYGKETPMAMAMAMAMPLSKLHTKYLRAMVQKLMRDYSSLIFQYSFLKDIVLAPDDQTLFGQIDTLLPRSEDRYSPLSALHEWSDAKVMESLNEAHQTLEYSQAVFNTPTEANEFNPGFILTTISFTTKQGAPESQLAYELHGTLKSWHNTFQTYKLPGVLAAIEHITGPSTREMIGKDFQRDVVDIFKKSRKGYGLDLKIHTFEEHIKALIRIQFKKAQFLKTTTALADAILKQQSESDEIDLRDPATLVKHIAVPGDHQDRPRLNPLKVAENMKTLEAEMKTFQEEFDAALTNKEKLREFLEKFFRGESEAHVPLWRYSGPLHPVEGRPTHFVNGLVEFDENGDPIFIFPEKIVLRTEDQTRHRVEKRWDELTQPEFDENGDPIFIFPEKIVLQTEDQTRHRVEKRWDELTEAELKGAFTSFYTRYLVMRMHNLVHRPNPAIDEVSLEGLIEKVFGENNRQHIQALEHDEQQRTLIETAFYIFKEGRRILLESEFITKILFLPEDIRELNNYTYSIFPLPENLKSIPMGMLYEMMKSFWSGNDLAPSELRKRWGFFYNNAANTLHQVIEDSHGITLFRMAYKFFVFTKQMEEYVSGLALIENNRINSETVSTMREEIEELRNQYQQLAANSIETDRALEEALKISKRTLANSQELEKQLVLKKEQLAKNIDREKELQGKFNLVNAEKKKLESELIHLKADLATAQANIKETGPLQGRIQILEAEIREKDRSIATYQKAMITFQAEINQKAEEKTNLEKDIARKNTEIGFLKSQFEQSQFEITELRIQMASYKKSMAAEVKKLQAQLDDNQRSYEERELLEATVAELQEELKAMQETMQTQSAIAQAGLVGIGSSSTDLIQRIASAKTPDARAKLSAELYLTSQRDLLSWQLDGLFIPLEGVAASATEAKRLKDETEAENRRLREENAALRKQLEDASKKSAVSQ